MPHVLVVGAGPAGTACSIGLRRAGIAVTLLDKQPFPRYAPGETLHPGVEPLLRQLGVWEAVRQREYVRHDGIVLEQHGQRTLEPYSRQEAWQGFQLDRASFDQLLLGQAVALGARFLPGCRLKNVETHQGGIVGLDTDCGPLAADFYIDATGRHASLARKLGVSYARHSPALVAYYGYVTPPGDLAEAFKNPVMRWDRRGWTWIAKVKEGVLNWNRVCRAEDRLPKGWLPEPLAHCPQTGPRKAVDVTWRVAERPSGRNHFLVGDAAFVLDPSSSHGVLKAITSGMMAAYLIGKLNVGGAGPDAVHVHYHHWLLDWYRKDAEALKEMYRQHGLAYWT
jgi:flavin-dependent dehydrogenase